MLWAAGSGAGSLAGGCCVGAEIWPALGKVASSPASPVWVEKLRFFYQYRELLANSLGPQGTRESVNIQVSVLLYQNSCCCFEIFSPRFLIYCSRASYIDSFY